MSFDKKKKIFLFERSIIQKRIVQRSSLLVDLINTCMVQIEYNFFHFSRNSGSPEKLKTSRTYFVSFV
jgi:hypothetical protein